MATPQYTALANLTLTETSSAINFTSISQAYRDLIIVVKANGGFQNALVTLNGDTTNANYPGVHMYGNGSTASSTAFSSRVIAYDAAADTDYNAILNIMDYSATDKHKTMLNRGNNPSGSAPVVAAAALRWANTAAVTSVAIQISAGTWSAGSTFALYGVK